MRKSKSISESLIARMSFVWFFLILMLVRIPLASAVDQPPTSTEAGVEEKSFREREKKQIEREKPLPEIIIPPEEQQAPPGVETPFRIEKISLEGNKQIPTSEIEPILAPYEKREVKLSELKEAAQKVTGLYRSRGYVTTRAIIPPQQVASGTVVMRVIEGKVGKIKVQGNRYFKSSLLQKKISTRENQVLRFDQLERDLKILNSHPDRKVKAVLEAGEEPETTDLILTVKDRLPIHARYEFNNTGTVFTGKLRQAVAFSAGNLMGLDDQLSGRVEISERADFIGTTIDYLVPVNSKGTSVSFGYSHVDVDIGKEFRDLNIEGQADIFRPAVVQRLFSTNTIEGEWVTGLDFKRIRSYLDDTRRSADDLRVLHFGPNLIERDRWGRSILFNEFNFGFDQFLGASDKNNLKSSRDRSGAQFFYYTVRAGRLQKLPLNADLVAQISALLSPDRLPSSEGFRLGGLDSVRGYSEGLFISDYGFLGSFELRIPPYFIPDNFTIKMPPPFDFNDPTVRLRDVIRFVVFLDFGKGFINDDVLAEENARLLVGIGGGIRIRFSEYASVNAFWAVPLAREHFEIDEEGRFHFSMNIGF